MAFIIYPGVYFGIYPLEGPGSTGQKNEGGGGGNLMAYSGICVTGQIEMYTNFTYD